MGQSDNNYKAIASKVPLNIDAVRGLACLLVVALHVIGDSADTGLHLPMTSTWHYVMGSIEFLRMPLFTALSGYLYAGNRVTRPKFPSFWQKKLRRLGIPFICASTVIWYLREHAYQDPTPLIRDLLFAPGHLWYIQALLIIFLAISIADSFIRPQFTGLVLAGLAIVMVAQAGLHFPTFFSVNGATYLAPYFLFGILLREQPQWLRDPRSGTLALGVVVIVLTAQQFGLYGLTDGVTLLQLPAALAGMACVVFLLQRMPRYNWLAAIGRYSYTVFLWHVIANAATRAALVKLDVTSSPLLFCVCFAASVTTPIILYHFARAVPLISVAITGEHTWAATKLKRVTDTTPRPTISRATAPQSVDVVA